MSGKIRKADIYYSRRGFIYQDKYVVYFYLKNLKYKIEEFFADFPFNEKISIDIRITYKEKTEQLFEIKSGETFKNDFERIGKALKTLFKCGIQNTTEKYFIVHPEFTEKIAKCWEKIIFLNTPRVVKTSEVKGALNWIIDNLKLKALGDSDRIYNFLQNIKIKLGYEDAKNNGIDGNDDLARLIISMLDECAKELKVTVPSFELPTELLMYELLHKVANYSGTGRDLNLEFESSIIKFFSKRYHLANIYDLNKQRKLITEKDIEDDIRKSFRTFCDKANKLPVEFKSISSDPIKTEINREPR